MPHPSAPLDSTPVQALRSGAGRLSQRSIARVFWGAALMLGLLGAFALLSFFHFNRLSRANDWNIHTYRVLIAVSELRQANSNIENRLRGFALIGDPEVLSEVRELRRKQHIAFKNLESLMSDQPSQGARLKQLRQLSQAIEDKYIRKYENPRALPADAVRLITAETATRRVLWLRLRDQISDIQRRENQRLATQTYNQAVIQRQASNTILGGSVFALLAALGLVGLLGRTARAYQHTAVSLAQSNEELRVQNEEKLIADERLRASEALFRQLAEDSHDLICLHAPNGKFAYASPAAQAMLGYEPRELVGQSPLDFFIQEDSVGAPVTNDPREFLSEMQNAPIVRRFRHKDGSEIWLEVIAHALMSQEFEEGSSRGNGSETPAQAQQDQVQQWHTIARDVSARIRDETRRQRLLEGLQNVVEATDELLLLSSEEALLERGVEIARERLGIERSAIFLVSSDGLSTRGTFGTNLRRQTTREDHRVTSHPQGWRQATIHPPTGARQIVVHNVTPFWGVEAGNTSSITSDGAEKDGSLASSASHDLVPWMGATLISSSGGELGVFFHDTLISGAPHDAVQGEILAIFCQILGALLERERTQTKLREHQKLLQTIIEHAPMMLYSVNRAGEFVLAQGRAMQRLGFGDDLLLGKTPEQVLGVESPSTRAIRAALTGETIHTNVEFNGRWLEMWREPIYDQSGEIEGAIGIGFDVSERVKAEAELREALELQKAVVDGAAYAIIALDANKIIRVFNHAAEKMLGYEADEVLGQHSDEFYPHIHLTSEVDAFARRVEAQYGTRFSDSYEALAFYQEHVAVSEEEWTYVRKDGSHVPVRLTGQLLRDPAGSITGYVGIIYDLTDSRRAQILKNEFVSIVSHELRTPLTAIRGSLGLMQGGVAGPMPSTALQMLDIASKNADRLVFLINDILDIEKIESGKMRFDMAPLALRELLQTAVEQNRAYGETLNVSIQLEPIPSELKSAQVEGDEGRLMQVLANLLSNACKFTPTGSQVTLRARALNSQFVRIEVQDEGEGVPAEFESQMFERFAQADSSATRQKGGTGLGLAIARAIIEKHGGRIGYKPPTPAQKGATFFFDLPVKTEAVVENPSGPRLLICDDDEQVAELLHVILSRSGYQTERVGTLADARERLHAGNFAAMTLDLQLPDGNGLELLHELRADARFAEFPVVVISAYCERGLLQGNAVNVLDWLQKPFDAHQLLNAIAQARHGGEARVLHVEDAPDVRRVTQLILGDAAHIVPAATLEQAREALRDNQFDLVLLDLGLPDGNGLDLVPLLNSQSPPVPVVIFSAREGNDFGNESIAAQLTKSRTSNAQLRETIEKLLKAPKEIA